VGDAIGFERRHIRLRSRGQPPRAPRAEGILLQRELGGRVVECAVRLANGGGQRGGVAAVVAVAEADHKVEPVAGFDRQLAGEGTTAAVITGVDAADVDAADVQRPAVVQHVDIGRRVPGDARERGVDLVLARCGTGPAHDAVLAGRTGVQRELARHPRDAQPLDGLGGGIVRDVRIGAKVRAPRLQAGQFGRLGSSAAMQVPAPAVEHDHPRVVQLAQSRQRGRGVAEQRPVVRLVEQSPHHHAGMIAVATDHAEQRLVVALCHLRRGLQAPGGVRLFVDHQPDLVAQVELIAGCHAGDEPDRIEPHHLDVQQVAPQHVGIRRQLQTDRAVVAGVRAAQKQPPAVQAKVAVLERKVAEAESYGALVKREALLPLDARRHAVEIRLVQFP
jgi:hypothetical protein